MESKAKLFVFSKIEVWMLFAFMVFIAVTCFIFGVRIGKNFIVNTQGFTTSDQAKVEMYSGQEEKVQKISAEETSTGGVKTNELKDESFQKLKEKIDKEFTDEENSFKPQKKIPKSEVKVEEPVKAVAPIVEETKAPAKAKYKVDAYSEKYTIQIASYPGVDDAEKFADGFVVRGYDPIINEASLQGRGTWYRVSLGVFETVGEAKDYIVKHKELFRGQDYVIEQFD